MDRLSRAVGLLLAGLTISCGLALSAMAQSAPVDRQAVEGVTVTAAPDNPSAQIDRRSYSLAKDLLASTGSLADALRNIPSVEVDLQGGLTLRGDPNVTILIDGKPAPALLGRARGDALQQFSADQFERVEVATTGSASLNPDGTGGVINLISKKARGAGRTGQAYVTAGSAGLKRAGVSFGYNSKTLTVSGQVADNHQRGKLSAVTERTDVDTVSGTPSRSRFDSITSTNSHNPVAQLSARYAATPKDDLSASASFTERGVGGRPFNRFVDLDGPAPQLLERQGAGDFLQVDTALSAGWKHTFATNGQTVSIDLTRTDSRYRDHPTWTAVRAFPAVMALESVRDDADYGHSELAVAYARSLPQGATLKAGYELKADEDGYDYGIARGPAPGALAIDLATLNTFRAKRTINAAYTSYERGIGDLTVQAGLRVEAARADLIQVTLQQRDEIDETRLYPSLHLRYKRDEETTLSAAISTRVQRPALVLLNAQPYLIDPRNLQQGNPRLRPQETTAFELGWERRRDGAQRSATLYYRDNHNEMGTVLLGLGDSQFVNFYNNLGRSQSVGLEMVGSGRLSPKLTYNANTDVYWNEIAAHGPDVDERSAFGVGGRASVNWQARPADLFQASLTLNGKRLVAQGYAEPWAVLNLGWRHKIDDRTGLNVVVSDALSSARYVRRLDTNAVHETYRLRPPSGAVAVRIDYRFGGAGSARTPEFNYDAGNALPVH
jgi:outer membrane receptor protein involved in Fe transport